MFIKYSDLNKTENESFDVCIVGSGPAGLSVAHKLNGTNKKVIILESGESEPDLRFSKLNNGGNSGERFLDTQGSRLRCFGGASRIWAGVCRPFSKLDFKEKSFLPLSGWPISFENVEPFYKEASVLLDFDYQGFTNPNWHKLYKTGLAFSEFKRTDSLLKPVIFQRASATNKDFSIKFNDSFKKSKNISVLFNATVVNSKMNPNNSALTSLEIRNIETNNLVEIKAKQFVFAAGALENPRLILLNSVIANRLEYTGSCFMSHPGFPEAAQLIHANYNKCMPEQQIDSSESHLLFEVNDKLKNKDAILRHSISPVAISLKKKLAVYKNNTKSISDLYNIFEVIDYTDFWSSIKSTICDISSMQSRTRIWDISVGVEQTPNKNNYISLSDEKDQFGVNKLNVHWTALNELEKKTIVKAAHTFSREVGITGVGMSKLSDELLNEEIFSREDPINHHAGTTRMADSASTGVVDKNCKVFNVDNLYIAGSSVFTTSSSVNPTFTIIALSLRLGQHLKTL